MAVIPLGYAEITLSWKVVTATEPILNVHGVNLAEFAGDAEAAIAAVATDAGEAFLPILDANISLDSVRLVADATDITYPVGEAGGASYALAPPNVTHLLTKVTNAAGRAYKGRMYLPGVDEANVNAGGFIAGARQLEVSEAGDAYTDKLAADDLPMVVLHSSDIPAPITVLTMVCQSKVATQRRRVR